MPPYENAATLQSGRRFLFERCLSGLFSTTVDFERSRYLPNGSFKRVAEDGLLRGFNYETVIEPRAARTFEIIDSVAFPLMRSTVRKRLSPILTDKYEMIEPDIEMLGKYFFERPLKILITGFHGLIGQNLAYFLECAGHDVWHLSRFESQAEKTVRWNPKTGECDAHRFEGFDIVVHLAGENIGKGRWTKRKKERILNSRLQGTANLVRIINGLEQPPEVFIGASAIGYYGNRGNEWLDETSAPGKGLFISEVCKRWERASRGLEDRGVRVVRARFGLVLSSAGGALRKMLPPFKWGMGGRLGSGRQYVSWVAIDDVVGSIYHLMMTPSLKGAVNVVSPQPVTNDVFTKKLAKRLNRRTGLPLPEFMIRMILGQKGEELLLTSTRVKPQRLDTTGYRFFYPDLSGALEHLV
ncbi:MAG: TIGR01777 family oxidoreductase [Chlamydiota bacterium]